MSVRAYRGYTSRNTMGSRSRLEPLAPGPRRPRMSSTARSKRHSTTGWIAVAFSLIFAWMRPWSSSMLRRTAIEKSGSTSWSSGRWVASKSPGFGDFSAIVPMSSSW